METSIYLWFASGRRLSPHRKNMGLDYIIIDEYMVVIGGIYK